MAENTRRGEREIKTQSDDDTKQMEHGTELDVNEEVWQSAGVPGVMYINYKPRFPAGRPVVVEDEEEFDEEEWKSSDVPGVRRLLGTSLGGDSDPEPLYGTCYQGPISDIMEKVDGVPCMTTPPSKAKPKKKMDKKE